MGCSGAGCCDAPEDDVGGEPFCDGKLLEDDAFVTDLRYFFRFETWKGRGGGRYRLGLQR